MQIRSKVAHYCIATSCLWFIDHSNRQLDSMNSGQAAMETLIHDCVRLWNAVWLTRDEWFTRGDASNEVGLFVPWISQDSGYTFPVCDTCSGYFIFLFYKLRMRWEFNFFMAIALCLLHITFQPLGNFPVKLLF